MNTSVLACYKGQRKQVKQDSPKCSFLPLGAQWAVLSSLCGYIPVKTPKPFISRVFMELSH